MSFHGGPGLLGVLADSVQSGQGVLAVGRGSMMRKVIVWNMVTLDGCFEGPKSWEIDWLEYVWGEELARFSLDQAREVGALLFGRVTFEGMESYWSTATGEIADFMNRVPKVVFSNTLEEAKWNNTRLVRGPAEEEVVRLKQEPGKDLFIFGSAKLTDSLTRRGLIDEYRIGLNPLVLGGGTPMFKPSDERMRLKLLEARPLRCGVVLLRYKRM
jgi:dihydrofolate reductase